MILKDLVMARRSLFLRVIKRFCEILEHEFGIKHDLNKIYRMRDKIDKS